MRGRLPNRILLGLIVVASAAAGERSGVHRAAGALGRPIHLRQEGSSTANQAKPGAATGSTDQAVARTVALLELLWDVDPDAAGKTLRSVAGKWRSGELSPEVRKSLEARLGELFRRTGFQPDQHPLAVEAAVLAAAWNDPAAVAVARRILQDPTADVSLRIASLESLAQVRDDGLLEIWRRLLDDKDGQSLAFREQLVGTAAVLDDAAAAEVLLRGLTLWEAALRPRVLDALTQRPVAGRALLTAMAAQQVDPNWLNANQLRQLAASSDEEVRRLTRERFGAVRSGRNPERELVVAQMGQLLRTTTGDAARGVEVFRKVCIQCHRLRGEGQDVGPDLTANGRSSLAQLLSNVFDPSLVIGPAYQARTVITVDGQVVTGLLAEDTKQRIVLKQQGGKQAVLARDRIEEISVSQLSLMPEGLEKQLSPQEIADLFAMLLAP